MKLQLSLAMAVTLVSTTAHADPVVVELFSSEGCSSCPAADEVLRTLEVPGIEIIPIEWHVDYWDNLGWKDPFSSRDATARQRQYESLLHVRGSYTPQMIVDGAREFVGSDRASAAEAIRAAATAQHVPLRASSAGIGRAQLEGNGGQAGAVLDVILTESGLESSVRQGENAGRTLKHGPVVRWSAPPQQVRGAFTLSVNVPSDASWNKDHLNLVAWIQEADGTIRGSTRISWAR
jgi:hypothetical protein